MEGCDTSNQTMPCKQTDILLKARDALLFIFADIALLKPTRFLLEVGVFFFFWCLHPFSKNFIKSQPLHCDTAIVEFSGLYHVS